ncbi:MAG TPA: DUF2786 domain-containing protein [Flavobacteriales bacterium]|jgi:hypothetical protein|nr:DUF2786 domain-containing protein [Flavobacteriales bacterium]
MADMLERIAKLLNQAENAGTAAEADVFMAKAQELATIHSIDLARARHATVAKERTIPVQRTIHIGERGSRGLRTLVDLYLGIASANDITCTIAHNATKVYAVGFAEDIDISEALFASLQVQMAKFAEEFKRAATWKDEKVYVEGGYRGSGWDREWVPGQYKPQTWLTARLNFQSAYAYRIQSRLLDAKRAEERVQREADDARAARPHLDDEGQLNESFKQWFFDNHGLDLGEDDSTAQEMAHGFSTLTVTTDGVMVHDGGDEWLAELLGEYIDALASQASNDSTALVLVEKREAVAEAAAPMLKRARGSYRGGTSGASSSSGRAAGRAAADRASLGRATAIGGTRGAISA